MLKLTCKHYFTVSAFGVPVSFISAVFCCADRIRLVIRSSISANLLELLNLILTLNSHLSEILYIDKTIEKYTIVLLWLFI